MSSNDNVIEKFEELVKTEKQFRDNYHSLIKNLSDKKLIKVLTNIMGDEDRHLSIANKMLDIIRGALK